MNRDPRQITSRSYEWLIGVIAITVVAVIMAVIFRPEAQVQAFGFGGVICLTAFGLLKIGQKMDETAEKVAANVENVKTTLVDTTQQNRMELAEVKTAAEVAASEVQEVKSVLREFNSKHGRQLDQIQRTGQATHDLANGALTAQMKLTAVASRGKADATNDPADIRLAEAAEKVLADHLEKQPQKEND